MLDKKSLKLNQLLKKNQTLNKSLLREYIDESEKNRVLYSVSLVQPSLKDVKKEGEEWIKRLSCTVLLINNLFENKFPYLVTRTYKYISYVTFDVDLFVRKKNFKKVIDQLKKKGFIISSHDNSLGGRFPGRQINANKKGFLTIDLHNDFTWQKRQFLDVDFVLANPRNRKIGGIMTRIPSAETDLILCLADIGHERFNITLLDIVWLQGLSQEVTDWESIFMQVKKHKWDKTFKRIVGLINQLSLDLGGSEIIPYTKSVQGIYALPFFLPLSICYLSYFENFKSTQNFPLVSFLYMHYTKARYYLSGKKRMPYYSPWFQIEQTT